MARIDPTTEMTWQQYAQSMLAFSLISILAVYAIQRLQGFLPLNPESQGAVSADSSFNTAIRFATNTNWQGYGGETTMSNLTQRRLPLRLGMILPFVDLSRISWVV